MVLRYSLPIGLSQTMLEEAGTDYSPSFSTGFYCYSRGGLHSHRHQPLYNLNVYKDLAAPKRWKSLVSCISTCTLPTTTVALLSVNTVILEDHCYL